MGGHAVPRLRARGVRRVYGGHVALADVDFDVAVGEVHGLLGANGAGKSTLVRIVSGADVADGGSVALDGVPLPRTFRAAEARAAGIAYIDQDRALIGSMSIAENVALGVGYPTRWGAVDATRSRAQARAALAAVGLEHDVAAPVDGLSLSDQTMVAVARALATDARLLLLDEPTSQLAAGESRWLRERLRRLVASGVSCVLITHDLEEALATCDRITVLRDGHVVARASAAELDEQRLAALLVGAEGPALGPPLPRVRSRPPDAAPPRLELDAVRCGRVGPLSLAVGAGEVVAVTGLADAGHLAVGDLLAGVAPADAGEVRIDGERCVLRDPRAARAAGVACVPPDRHAQGIALQLSARENLFPTGRERTTRAGAIATREERLAARRALEDAVVVPSEPEAVLATMSGGNQQKVLVARCMETGPRLLVLCEPTVGVDVGARADLYHRIRTAAAGGLAVLLVGSDLDEVATLADRALVLRRGRPVGELEGPALTAESLLRRSGGL